MRRDMLCLSSTESKTPALNKYRPVIHCRLQMFVEATNQIAAQKPNVLFTCTWCCLNYT